MAIGIRNQAGKLVHQSKNLMTESSLTDCSGTRQVKLHSLTNEERNFADLGSWLSVRFHGKQISERFTPADEFSDRSVRTGLSPKTKRVM